jgi:hypothetical protein
MPERKPRNINVSVHQIRADSRHNPFSGLAVTGGKDGLLHIDPRPMPGYHGQVASDNPERWLALSEAYQPDLHEQGSFRVVRRLSLRSSILNSGGISLKQRGKFRARRTMHRAKEGYALVGIVKHDPEGIYGRAWKNPAHDVHDLGSYREITQRSRGTLVSLVLMEPGGRFGFIKSPQDAGHSTKFEVINDEERGVIVRRFAATALTKQTAS